jgi:hypothetical protein
VLEGPPRTKFSKSIEVAPAADPPWYGAAQKFSDENKEAI